MYKFITNRGDIFGDLTELIRCFITDTENDNTQIVFTYVKTNQITFYITINDKKYVFSYAQKNFSDKKDYARYDLFVNKTALYKSLSNYFNIELPWGSLTGIRPTRLAARLISNGVSLQNVANSLHTDYCVSMPKAKLAAQILQVQQKVISDKISVASAPIYKHDNSLVNLYVHIPFCPTRCAYCSFISEGIERKQWLLSPYAEALVQEIRLTKELIRKNNKNIFSVYIGGGTPTVMPPALLNNILAAAFEENTEFTCEAGRPDTLNEENMQIMYSCGVNRISINPQTLHDKTLKLIGRAHTSEQFFNAYKLAIKFGFVKNVDLIAGLSNETLQDFKFTLNKILELQPENITIHTLCTKRGSRDAQSEIKHNAYTKQMVDYSVNTLKRSGYVPYYLYRQKQMADNLENIGWCKPGFLCVNNVTVMEETLPVYACGAGAISKILTNSGKIERIANPKDVLMYLREFDMRMEKKEAFLK